MGWLVSTGYRPGIGRVPAITKVRESAGFDGKSVEVLEVTPLLQKGQKFTLMRKGRPILKTKKSAVEMAWKLIQEGEYADDFEIQ